MEKTQNKPLFSNQDLKRLILPLVMEQFLAMTVGMADSIMIANVGEAAVSAVSLVDTINVLIINVFSALATGGAVVAGQYIGKKREDVAGQAADQLVIFTFGIAVVIMLFIYLAKGFILYTVFGNIEDNVRNFADRYLMIVALSIPFIALYNAGAALFRTMGNSKVSMYTSLIMNGVNIIGNAILIYGLKMEVEGAAIPTLISRVVAAVIIVALLRNQNLMLHFSRPFRLKVKGWMVMQILRIGIPNGLENSMFQLGKIIVLSLVTSFGTASIAANAVGNTMATFQLLACSAINLAIVPVVSRCVGAGDFVQARFYVKKLMKYLYVASLVWNVALFAILPVILHVYNLSEEATRMVWQILELHVVCLFLFWPRSFTYPNVLRAAGDVKYAMVIGIASMWIFRIVLSWILGKYLGLGLFGVWLAMITDWAVRGVFFTIRYRGEKWTKYRL